MKHGGERGKDMVFNFQELHVRARTCVCGGRGGMREGTYWKSFWKQRGMQKICFKIGGLDAARYHIE